MIKVYSTSAGTDPASLESDVNGAYESAKIVADARPSLGAYTDLATWAYLSGNTEAGDQAKQKALKEAPDSTTKKQIETQLKQAQQQRQLVVKALKKSAPDQSQLQDPLSGLSGGTSGALPGATP